jgi:hypothetical protein
VIVAYTEASTLTEWVKPQNPSVKTAGNPTEIQTGYLPNKNGERYQHRNILGSEFFNGSDFHENQLVSITWLSVVERGNREADRKVPKLQRMTQAPGHEMTHKGRR